MTYTVKPSDEIKPILRKLKRKDPTRYEQVRKKSIELEKNPELGKPIRYDMKWERRLHIGSYVLTYSVDKKENLIILLDYDHHDNVYKK